MSGGLHYPLWRNLAKLKAVSRPGSVGFAADDVCASRKSLPVAGHKRYFHERTFDQCRDERAKETAGAKVLRGGQFLELFAARVRAASLTFTRMRTRGWARRSTLRMLAWTPVARREDSTGYLDPDKANSSSAD